MPEHNKPRLQLLEIANSGVLVFWKARARSFRARAGIVFVRE
jgi:hypothetical protein